MDDILGYDCDGKEIYEYRILRAIWSNDMDIIELENVDPRQYCAVIAYDGNPYAISVYDWWNEDLIRKRERITGKEIPTIVKPISEMENYELAKCSDGEFYYTLDRNELKKHVNSIIKKNKSEEKEKYIEEGLKKLTFKRKK